MASRTFSGNDPVWGSAIAQSGMSYKAPPTGRGGQQTYGALPFGSLDEPGLSPAERRALEITVDSGVADRLRQSRSFAPSIRRQTQGEIIDMALLYGQLGNPFSVRRIPFSVLRDMITDPMIGFALYYTKIPLMKADWSIECADSQIAAAVDEAFRPVNPRVQVQITNKLAWGYQPMCKRFKLGQLRSFYRDPRGEDPEKDLPTWTTPNVDALLWDYPFVLAPEHCMPRWNDRGEFIGFYYSVVPIPNPAQIGVAALYGYTVVPGYEIPAEFAMWPVNEADEQFGSIFGSPRTKRAYRYWWSYWYRWALADRLFENCSDPVKVVYYPTDFTEGIDAEDPSNPTAVDVQQRALAIGEQARQGATLAIPGDFMIDESTGRMSAVRKWAIEYLEPKTAFEDLNKSFVLLDGLKFRAMFLPEEAFVQPTQGQRAARNVATQLGELYQEAQQQLADENDAEINEHMIPQFVATNFPDRAGIPCRKVTHGFGAKDSETIKQIIQLIGQVKGEVLPVDIRALLDQMGIPLMSERQQKQMEAQIAEEAQAQQPQERPPTQVGMQGYNSGVGKTRQGTTFYYSGPERIDLSTSHQGFLADLPDVPAYRDASVRASMMKLRKLFLDRYKAQVDSFVEHLRSRTTLRLAQQAAQQEVQTQVVSQQGAQTPAQPTPSGSGLTAATAVGVAATLVGVWAATQAADAVPDATAALLLAIAERAGKRELKAVNLGAEVFDPSSIGPWSASRAAFVVGSVDQTLRSELTTFLTEQLQRDADPEVVAQAAEQRFADTAQTHADRVIGGEALPAYNRGALTAFRDAGISQVQAHDASEGLDQLTDAECRARNAEVMSVGDALAAADDEHPHGTLWFSPLSTDDLTIERVDSFPTHLNLNGDSALLATYEEQSETLFVLEEASEEQQTEFLLALGGALALTR